MPVFDLKCPACGESERKLMLTMQDRPCPKCETVMVRAGTGPTSRIIEIRDNGFMPKKVEQLADVQELVRQRSTEKPEPDKV